MNTIIYPVTLNTGCEISIIHYSASKIDEHNLSSYPLFSDLNASK